MKKLRRHGIADLAAANAFLEAAYWADHNRPLRARPGLAGRLSRRGPARAVAWRRSFGSRRPARCPTIGSCGTPIAIFNWSGRVSSRRRAAPCRCSKTRAGQIEIRYRDRLMRWTEIARAAGRRAAPAAPRPSRPPTRRPDRDAAGSLPIIRGIRRSRIMTRISNWRRTDGPGSGCNHEAACGRCRSRGRGEHAPTAPWKTTDRFSTAPTGTFFQQGDISIELRPGTFLFRFDSGCLVARPSRERGDTVRHHRYRHAGRRPRQRPALRPVPGRGGFLDFLLVRLVGLQQKLPKPLLCSRVVYVSQQAPATPITTHGELSRGEGDVSPFAVTALPDGEADQLQAIEPPGSAAGASCDSSTHGSTLGFLAKKMSGRSMRSGRRARGPIQYTTADIPTATS